MQHKASSNSYPLARYPLSTLPCQSPHVYMSLSSRMRRLHKASSNSSSSPANSTSPLARYPLWSRPLTPAARPGPRAAGLRYRVPCPAASTRSRRRKVSDRHALTRSSKSLVVTRSWEKLTFCVGAWQGPSHVQHAHGSMRRLSQHNNEKVRPDRPASTVKGQRSKGQRVKGSKGQRVKGSRCHKAQRVEGGLLGCSPKQSGPEPANQIPEGWAPVQRRIEFVKLEEALADKALSARMKQGRAYYSTLFLLLCCPISATALP
eukprot:2394566-Rhodomonas_salina.1